MRRFIEMPTIELVIAYLAGFFILWEWIRPLEEVTNTGNLHLFVIFIGICFFLFLFRVHYMIAIPVKLLFILYSIHLLFYELSFFEREWFFCFLVEMKENIDFLVTAQWFDLTDMFRTFLFFVLLWLQCYLLSYWLQKKETVFLFLIFTIIYIAILDTFFPYDGKWPIVQTLVFGFFLLSLLHMFQLRAKERLTFRAYKYILPIVGVMAVIFVGSYVLPKYPPQWPDPALFLQSAAEKYQQRATSTVTKSVGYDSNDEQLGGPFRTDDSPVFSVLTENVHYWRVEVKETYTGKGWVSQDDSPYVYQDSNQINLPTRYDDNVEIEEAMASISLIGEQKEPHYIYSPQLEAVTSINEQGVLVNVINEKIMFDRPHEADSYDIVYNYPKFSIAALQEAGAPPEHIASVYTELPQALPERVRILAEDVTSGKTTQYDKVKEIERFLALGNYTYETKDVPIPDADQDYVDQFLFETMKGYCDNFSSAMVVMLRALDIPARWVKGYTQGNFARNAEDGKRVYEINNEHAHSWVEVYFHGVGWVPFEPTKGFYNPFQFYSDASAEANELEVRAEEKQLDVQTEVNEEETEAITTSSNNTKMPAVIFSMFIIFLIAWLTKKHWLVPFYCWRIKMMKEDKKIIYAYDVLMHNIEKKLFARKENETLREYAANIDVLLETEEMGEITKEYERVLYAGKEPEQAWENIAQRWQTLLKKIIS